MKFGLEEKKQNDPVKMIFILGSRWRNIRN